MVAPVGVGLAMSFTAGQTLKFPPDGLSLRWYQALLDPVRSAPIHTAIWNSLQIALFSVLGSLLFAMPAAYGATRLGRRAAGLVEPLMLTPLVLPTLVYGLAALIAFGSIGLRRPSVWSCWACRRLRPAHVPGLRCHRAAPRSRAGGSLDAARRRRLHDFRAGDAAADDAGILAGCFLVFMQSLDNVSVTLFLADPRTSVLPLRMFQYDRGVAGRPRRRDLRRAHHRRLPRPLPRATRARSGPQRLTPRRPS